LYDELKKRKKCSRCKKPRGKRFLEIHHKVPVCMGGTNERANLLAVCRKCHEILDAEELEND
jgi:predicted HNH restriction endonuclease